MATIALTVTLGWMIVTSTVAVFKYAKSVFVKN